MSATHVDEHSLRPISYPGNPAIDFISIGTASGDDLAGPRRRVPVAVCAGCGGKLILPAFDKHPPPPEVFVRRLMEAHWETDGRKARRTTCPSCIRRKRQSRKSGDEPMAPNPQAAQKAAPTPAQKLNGAAPPRAAAPCPPPAPISPGLTPEQHRAAAEERTPNMAQKRAIRDSLSEYVDEKTCRYTYNASDQSIGEELGVPAAWVRKMRVEWYGEPDYGPDIVGALAEIRRLQENVSAMETEIMDRIVKATEPIKAALSQLEARYRALQAQVG